MNATQKHSKKKIIFGIIALLFVAVIVVCAFYLNDYYHVDETAMADFAVEKTVEEIVISEDMRIYVPKDVEAGFIFYPGGKVEALAYEPLMTACASEGILCILVEMPFNLAVFDVDAAEGLQGLYPEIEEWYIGGHSLGGSMAAAYLADHVEDYEGLILLGSYSTEDFSENDLAVLSIYGSEDQVLNREKYENYKSNLPEDFTEIVIEGGCHAYFGMYGAQEGDGTPTITNEEQIWRTVEAVDAFVERQ